jgi:hypothetical protein
MVWWEKLRERPCERPRWDFNIKIDLKEIESGGVWTRFV